MEQPQKVTILMVDDQPNNLKILSEILHILDQNIIAVSSSQEAIEYINHQAFAVIILDVNMPGMNGFELAEYIRSQPRIQNTPIMFLSGTEMTDISYFQGYELGAVDYLIKPIYPKIFRSKVSIFVEIFRQKQELKHKLEEIAQANQKLENQIIKYKKAQSHLAYFAKNLEKLVEQRTIELQKTNFNLSDEIKQRQRMETVLRTMAVEFSKTSAETFFQSLIQYLVKAEGIDYAFVCELNDSYSPQAQGKAFYTDGVSVQTLEYNLIDTPCLETLKKHFCIYPNQVQKCFPKDMFLQQFKVDSYAGMLLTNSHGKPLGILGVMGRQPMTDLKFTEEVLRIFAVRAAAELERQYNETALRESEQFYRLILSNISDAVLITDEQGNFTYICPNIKHIFGYSCQEIENIKTIDQLFGQDLFEITQLEKLGEIINIEREICDKLGNNHVILINIKQIYIKEKNFLFTCRDITERKQVEISLRDSQARLAKAQEIAHLGNCDWNLITHKFYWSEETYRIFGLDSEELNLTEKTFFDCLHPNDREFVIKQFKQALSNQESYNIDYRIIRPDKTIRIIQSQGNIILDSQGNPIQMIGTVQDITEAKLMEDHLKESEEKLRHIVTTTADGLIVMNHSGYIYFVNPAAESFFGLKAHEFSGYEWNFSINHDSTELAIEHPNNKLLFLEVKIVETLWDGEPVYLISLRDVTERKQAEVKLQKLNDELEQKVEVRTRHLQQANQHLRQEILERQQAEEALHKSEAQLRSMFENAAIGIAFVDLEGKPFKCNPALEKFFGYRSQELAQMGFTEVTYPEDIMTDLLLYQDLFTNNKNSYQMEKRYIRKDGQQVWGHLTVSLVRNIQGKPQFAIAMVQDISDAKQSEIERILAQEALKENQIFLRNVIDTVPNLIFVKNRQGKYTLANQTMAMAYGTTVEELEGKSDADFHIIPAEVTQVQIDEEAMMKSLQSLLIPEQPLTLSSGEVRYYQTIKTPLISPNGKAHYILGVATDITEHKQIQQKIEKALIKEKELNQLKTQFIDVVSHEFRTPLTSILGYAELLERHSDKLSEQKKNNHLHKIRIAGQRLSDLIEDVLCISRAESGKLQLNPIPINLEVFCQDLMEEIQIGIGKNHEMLLTRQPDSFNTLNEILLDEKLLRHILSNLLSNAIKYSSLGSRVELSLYYKNQQVIFEISDQGIGIPAEAHPKLFDSFYRASNVGNIPGTGLGLHIVYKYVTLHGGTIDFSSKISVGTTFRIKIPISETLCKLT